MYYYFSMPDGCLSELLSRRIFMIFNPRPTPYCGDWPQDAAALELHPVQLASVDSAVREGAVVSAAEREVEVPPRTVAVFVELRT
jgi:hypothetical protein